MLDTAVVTEKSTLKAHDKLLFDVIKRQAGTLKKAMTEGTMNSIEAGTPEIIIKMWENVPVSGEFTRAFLRIKDLGIGIKTEEEITLHFETFGQPHEANENTTWKQFRMGRGQMFAFGRNVWRTSQFQMEVDIEKMGLDYKLTKGLPEVDGCTIDIELYTNPIGTWQCRSIEALREEVAEQVRYVNVPVIFNDKQISADPATLNWDYEDENAYYLFTDSSSIKIYNLGIYTTEFSKSQLGVGGIVVSKKQLKVNFARNDIQSDCPVFQPIREVIQKNKIKKASNKRRALSTGERYSLLRDFRDGSISFRDLSGKRIFRTAQSKWISWNMIVNSPLPWTFAPEGNMVADKAMCQGAALCLSQGMLDELSYYDEKDCFLDWIMKEQLRHNPNRSIYNQNISQYEKKTIEKQLHRKRLSYLKYDNSDSTAQENLSTLKEQFNEEYKFILPKKYSIVEKRVIQLLNEHCKYALGQRKICLGFSTVALAWTDGSTYIALDRSWLKGLCLFSEGDLLKLFGTISHELAHDENSAGTHIHGPEFYENYYRLTHEKVYHNNPLYPAFGFKKAIQRSRIEEKKQKELEKEKKMKAKLGITV